MYYIHQFIKETIPVSLREGGEREEVLPLRAINQKTLEAVVETYR
jgi:hypothetical protein